MAESSVELIKDEAMKVLNDSEIEKMEQCSEYLDKYMDEEDKKVLDVYLTLVSLSMMRLSRNVANYQNTLIEMGVNRGGGSNG